MYEIILFWGFLFCFGGVWGQNHRLNWNQFLFFFFFLRLSEQSCSAHSLHWLLGQLVDCVLMWQRKQHNNSATTQLLFLSPSTGRFLLYIAERSLAILRLSVFLCFLFVFFLPSLFYFEMHLSCWGKSIEDVWRKLTVGAEFPLCFSSPLEVQLTSETPNLSIPELWMFACFGGKGKNFYRTTQESRVRRWLWLLRRPFSPMMEAHFGGKMAANWAPPPLSHWHYRRRSRRGIFQELRCFCGGLLRGASYRTQAPFRQCHLFFPLRVASWHKRTAPFGCFFFLI